MSEEPKESLEDAKLRVIKENMVKKELHIQQVKKFPELTEEYISFIDELKAIIVEGEFASRWRLLECYHEVGKFITESHRDTPLTRIAEDLQIPKYVQTLYRCVSFYKKYPDINKLPEGKSISWHKVVNKYLFKGGSENKQIRGREVDWIICPFCLAHFSTQGARKDKNVS